MESISIDGLMISSNVGFGTSGARGLVTAMTDKVCYAYTVAFLQYLHSSNQIVTGNEVALAGDLRPSSPRIIAAVAQAITDSGFKPILCGYIPSPAVALFGLTMNIPSIMVTGSHIPDDRNGVKFNTPSGEILKPDEEGIRSQIISIDSIKFGDDGDLLETPILPPINDQALKLYQQRFLSVFPEDLLKDLKIGVYEHSGVARDILSEVIAQLGAEIIRLSRSDTFVPVDTEAIREEDVQLAKQWSNQHKLDAIISTDGDGDRPLISDEYGNWLRGDIVGVLTAKYLNADVVVTPVSSNSVVEKCDWFKNVIRTRIGSPFVIEGMQSQEGRNVVGYEANGGVLQNNNIPFMNGILPSLPTRDALLPIISILAMSKQQNLSISLLCQQLPSRYTCSDRVKDFPLQVSREIITKLSNGKLQSDSENFLTLFGEKFGHIASIDYTDGVRFTLTNNDIIHLRPSGNAPELRCYTESDSEEGTQRLNSRCIEVMNKWRA